MSSFVGLSTAKRNELTKKAKQLQGQLILTIHKAQHLKNSSLSGAASDPYATLAIGSEKYRSTVCRGGGIHPKWEQQFLFQVKGTEDPLNDGALHILLFDGQAGCNECIGRLDLNLVQLLEAGKRDDAQWHPVADQKNLAVHQGFLLLTATFTGTGLEEAEQVTVDSSAAEEAVPSSPEPKVTLNDGEHAISVPNGTTDASSPTEAASVTPALTLQDLEPDNQRPTTAAPRSAFNASTNRPTTAAPRLQSPTASITVPIQFPNPISPRPVPPPANKASTYFKPPTEDFPSPLPNPPAPGYPIDFEAAVESDVLVVNNDASNEDQADEAVVSDDPLITAYDIRHDHILQLVPQIPSGRFICSRCEQEGFTQVYHCTEGCASFNLHEACLQPTELALIEDQLPDMRLDPRHDHPLTWLESIHDGSYSCNGCGGGGEGEVWHCNDCHFNLHPGCAR